VQLFAPPTNPADAPFINSEKNTVGVNNVRKILGFSRVRFRVRVRVSVSVRVSSLYNNIVG